MEFGLEPTGVLDDRTKALMEKTRCGMKDKDFGARKKRQLDFYWKKGSMKYYLGDYPPRLSRDFVDSEVNRAFTGWQQFTPSLQFQRVYNQKDADMVLNFWDPKTHDKRCKEPYGRNVVAHAFYPEVGLIHFNTDGDWTPPDKLGRNLFHEIGHALGLDHVNDDDHNLMYPYDVATPRHFSGSSIYELRSTYALRRKRNAIRADRTTTN